MNRVMTTDPGISGTGVVIWESEEGFLPNPDRLVTARNITARGAEVRRVATFGWIEKVKDIVDRCASMADDYGVTQAYCEFPAFHGGTAAGQMVAAKGDLVKLTYFVGWWSAVMMSMGIVPRMVTVQEWKGQLPKSVSHRRIRHIMQRRHVDTRSLGKMSSHVLDAIGIGLYVAGVF